MLRTRCPVVDLWPALSRSHGGCPVLPAGERHARIRVPACNTTTTTFSQPSELTTSPPHASGRTVDDRAVAFDELRPHVLQKRRDRPRVVPTRVPPTPWVRRQLGVQRRSNLPDRRIRHRTSASHQ